MPTTNPTKINPPRIGKVYARKRLFKQLDTLRHRSPVIWVSSPAGSGKTTLVSSYLLSKKIIPLWYQIDEGDADVASFFYYLGQLGNPSFVNTGKKLPLLTPEYLSGLPMFTRNYFRELYSQIQSPSVLVLDNYQDAGPDIPLHELLPVGLGETPEGITTIIISRSNPPVNFTRLRTNKVLAHMTWKDIQLSESESIGIGKLQNKTRIDDEILKDLHTQTGGWTAGLVLLLEQLEKQGVVPSPSTHRDPQDIFDYFMEEIFSCTDKNTQQLLLKTALLPKITVTAAIHLSGQQDAENILEGLILRNYFTVKHMTPEITYEYHPLFRDFLKSELDRYYSTNDIIELKRRTAHLLDLQGDSNNAIILLNSAQDWQTSIPLITQNAQSLVEQGRGQTVLRWINLLPANIIGQQPWVLHWKGICLLPTNQDQARRYLNRAFQLFKTQGEVIGKVLSWSMIIDSFIYEWSNLKPLDDWIEESGKFSQDEISALPSNIKDIYACGIFTALMYRQSWHPDIGIWEEHVIRIVLESSDDALRIKIGPFLLMYYSWFVGNLFKGKIVFDAVRPLGENKNMPPLVLTSWHFMASSFSWMNAEIDRALEYAESGIRIANETGVHAWDVLNNMQATCTTILKEDREKSLHYLSAMHNTLIPGRTLDMATYHYISAWRALFVEEGESALEHAKRTLQYTIDGGSPMLQLFAMTILARIYIALGEYSEATSLLDEIFELCKLHNAQLLIYTYWLAKADLKYKQNKRDDCVKCLFNAFSHGKQRGLFVTTWVPSHIYHLLEVALDNEIEPEYINNIISKFNFVPPTGIISDRWPFPIKLYTLGRVSLLMDKREQSLSGKSAQRPMTLLLCLIAFGGRKVSQEKIMAALWPDTTGDKAAGNFRTTLHRLRTFLQHEEALVMEEGRLTLNSRYAWVDVWSLERRITELEKALQGRDVNAQTICTLSDAIFALYQGPFLGREAEQFWLLPLQERLRNRILQTLSQLGDYWREQSNMKQAIVCYEKAIETDPLLETFYQKLMRLYADTGKRSEAMATYQRCRKALSTSLGVTPAQETMRLFTKIENQTYP